MTVIPRIIAFLVVLPAVAGCNRFDPLTSDRYWRPLGVNSDNIAAQVVNPVDFLHGRDPSGGADGDLAAAAVQRLRTGHVRPLPDSGVSDFHVQQTPSGAGGGGGT